MKKEDFKNPEWYNDPTPAYAIKNAEDYIYNPDTFCNHIERKLGDAIRARFTIYFDESTLIVEIQNFEFVFTTKFRNIKDSLGANFLAHYIITETIKRYKKHVNIMFFRKPELYI